MVFPSAPLPAPRPPCPWKPLGEQLVAARFRRGWTPWYVASQLGYAVTTVRYWERGLHRPHRRALHELAALFALPYAELAALAGYPADDGDAR